jgi:hypothetical protein
MNRDVTGERSTSEGARNEMLGWCRGPVPFLNFNRSVALLLRDGGGSDAGELMTWPRPRSSGRKMLR